jgi:hypothetical protein
MIRYVRSPVSAHTKQGPLVIDEAAERSGAGRPEPGLERRSDEA